MTKQGSPVELSQAWSQVEAEPARSGFGLGLLFVRRVAERHRGRVRADSTLGHGACFKFYFGHAADCGYPMKASGVPFAGLPAFGQPAPHQLRRSARRTSGPIAVRCDPAASGSTRCRRNGLNGIADADDWYCVICRSAPREALCWRTDRECATSRCQNRSSRTGAKTRAHPLPSALIRVVKMPLIRFRVQLN